MNSLRTNEMKQTAPISTETGTSPDQNAVPVKHDRPSKHDFPPSQPIQARPDLARPLPAQPKQSLSQAPLAFAFAFVLAFAFMFALAAVAAFFRKLWD